jgi:DNA invertase Pin-like site-specific DNA recombinase
MLFVVAAMAAGMERDLIRERTLDGLAAAGAHGGGEPVAAIAEHRRAGRSALYRALVPYQEQAALPG